MTGRDDASGAGVRTAAQHDAFHDTICRLAGRPRLAAQVRNLRQSVVPYLRLYLSAYQEAEMPGFEHGTLLAAIERGHPQACEITMREHVMSAATGIVEFLRKSEVHGAPGAPGASR